MVTEIEGFKKYIRRGRSYEPKVVIRKTGHIAFNSGAIQKYDLDVYEYVILFISEDRKRVAVKFTNNEKESGIIKVQARPGNFAVAARPFLRMYDIEWTETVNLDFVWDKVEKIAIFRVDGKEIKDVR
jgi:hypothetical protein